MRWTRRARRLAGVGVAGLAALLAACASVPVVPARSGGGSVRIDGDRMDWEGDYTPLDGNQLWLGVRNDDDYLYLAILSESPAVVTPLVFRGLDLWVDPSREKQKSTGLRFPLGEAARAKSGGRRGSRAVAPPDSGSGESGRPALPEYPSAALLPDSLGRMADRLELLDGDSVTARLSLSEAGKRGIEAAARLDRGAFFYELRIPLRARSEGEFAVGARPGDTIEIGLQTPKVDQSRYRRRDREEGGEPAGGFRGGEREAGEGGPPRGRGFRGRAPGLDLWREIVLAGPSHAAAPAN